MRLLLVGTFWHVAHAWPFPSQPLKRCPSRIRRGTAPARRRAPSCRSRAPPGLAAPSPRAAPSRGPPRPAAARRAAPGSDGRVGTARGSRGTGGFGPPGGAAWHRGVPPPRAPAARRARPRPRRSTAGRAARPRLSPHPSGRRLGGSGAARHPTGIFSSKDERRRSVLRNHFFSFTSFPIFSSSKTKPEKIKTSTKTSIHLRRRHACSLVAFDVLIESRFQLCPAGSIEIDCHGSDGGIEWQTPAAEVGRIHSEVECVCVCVCH